MNKQQWTSMHMGISLFLSTVVFLLCKALGHPMSLPEFLIFCGVVQILLKVQTL